MFLLDTDHISILQEQTEPEYSQLVQRMSQHPPTAFYRSVVSFAEQTRGAHNYVNQARDLPGLVRGYALFERIRADYAASQVLAFDQTAAAAYDSLRKQRLKVGTQDLRIAAIALANNKIVLTRNTKDFRKVPGLKVEDWTV